MKYGYVKDAREFKFGPGEKFATIEHAIKHASKVRNEVVSELTLKGYYKAIVSIKQEILDSSVVLKIVIKYPCKIF